MAFVTSIIAALVNLCIFTVISEVSSNRCFKTWSRCDGLCNNECLAFLTNGGNCLRSQLFCPLPNHIMCHCY